MASRRSSLFWPKGMGRRLGAAGRQALKQGQRLLKRAAQDGVAQMNASWLPDTAAPAGGRGHWSSGLALIPGGARRYRCYLPAPRLGGERLPLLVLLHGCGQEADSFARSTRIAQQADRSRFGVLMPEQDRLSHPQRCWRWWDTRHGRAQHEVALVLRAIDDVCRLHPIDPARVAVAGLSAGAGLAALLAMRAPTRFKAVVMHSGVPPGLADSTVSAIAAMRGRTSTAPGAAPARLGSGTGPAEPPPDTPADPWPALLVIHGTADPVVAVRNAHLAVEQWAAHGSAVATPARLVQRGHRYAMTVTDYRAGRALVATLAEVHGLGHAWSGGTAREAHGDPKGPDATRLLWAFVARQFAAA